jgi:hypothetical protein
MAVSLSETARAACSPAAANGVEAVCVGNQSVTYGNGSEVGVGLTVVEDAIVDVSGVGASVYAINIKDLDLYNLGGIRAVGLSISASAVFSPSFGRLSVFNTGSIDVTSDNDDAYAIHANQGAAIVDNSGTITASSGTSLAGGVYSFQGSTSVVNRGLISARSGGAGAAGVWGNQGDLWLMNTGTIEALGYNSIAAAAYTFGGLATIVNYGDISAVTTGVNDAWAVFAYGGSSSSISLLNVGSISASATSGFSYGVMSTGGLSVQNAGLISSRAAGLGARAYGLYSQGFSPIYLYNTGTISAYAPLGNAWAINIDVFGPICDDLLVLGAGSTLIGGLELGGGSDQIRFIGGNHNLTFSPGNLSAAIFNGSTIPYAVSGDRVAAIDPTPLAAATSWLQSTTRVIAALAPEAPQAGLDVKQADGSFTWLRAFGGRTDEEAEGSLSRFDNTFYGAALGVDRPLTANLRTGVMLGGLGGSSSLASGYGNTDSQMIIAGTYARYDSGASYLKAALQLGYGSQTSSRWSNNNLLLSGRETSTGSTDNWYFSPEMKLGHRFSLGRVGHGTLFLNTEAQLRYLYGSYGTYTEVGGTDGFSLRGRSTQSMEEQLTLKLSHVSSPAAGQQIRYNLTAGLLGSQSFGNPMLQGSLLGQSITFVQPGASDWIGALAGLGVEFIHGKTTVFAQADYVGLANGTDLSGRVGVKVMF